MLQAMEGKPRNTGDKDLCDKASYSDRRSLMFTVRTTLVSSVAVASCSSDMFNKLKYCVVEIVFEVVD